LQKSCTLVRLCVVSEGLCHSVLQELDGLRRRLTDAEQAAELRRQSLLAEKAKAQNAMGQLAISREKASRTCWSDFGKYIIADILLTSNSIVQMVERLCLLAPAAAGQDGASANRAAA
jgi:hypothetical protein